MADWSQLKVVDLRAELKRRSLPSAGLKAQLVARLEADDREAAQQEVEYASEENNQPAVVEAVEIISVQSSIVRDHESSTEETADSGEEAKPTQTIEEHSAPSAPTGPEPAAPVAQNPSRAPDGDTGQDREVTADSHLATDNDQPIERTASAASEGFAQEPAEEPAHEPAHEPAQDPAQQSAQQYGHDAQKRKRRSDSPPPVEEEMTQKRARADDDFASDDTGAADIVMTSALPEEHPSTVKDDEPSSVKDDEPSSVKDDEPSSMKDDEPSSVKDDQPSNVKDDQPSILKDDQPSTLKEDQPFSMKGDQPIEMERMVQPALHLPTASVYISNLMRPLRPEDLLNYLVSLAATDDFSTGKDAILKFYLDQIRTHAFVTFDSVATAQQVRAALHGTVWPNETNRKALSVDFIPSEIVDEWIGTEEAGGRRSSARWRVIYRDDASLGTVQATLVGSSLPPRRGQFEPSVASGQLLPPRMGPDNANAMPIGPRAHHGRDLYREGDGDGARRRDLNVERSRRWDVERMPPPPPPNGPRGREADAQSTTSLSDQVRTTRANPPIPYQTVSESVARRRLNNMATYRRSETTSRYFDSNRYSFEDGDRFVDRGREVFLGIRPPHREAERRFGRLNDTSTPPPPPVITSPPRRESQSRFRDRGDHYAPRDRGPSRRSGGRPSTNGGH